MDDEWRQFLRRQRELGSRAIIAQAEAARRRLGLPNGWPEREEAERQRQLRFERGRAQLLTELSLGPIVMRPQSLCFVFATSI